MVEQVELGLKNNWKQFTLLVIVNAFVGGMIGLERTIFPEFAASKFHIDSNSALLSFIVVFGVSKAISNYYTGKLANRFGRRNLLLAGWILSIPVPFLLIFSMNWYWVLFANVLLGIHQGLTWSSTVVMKIDLIGEKNRGLAMGLNEFSGYLAVGLVAYFTANIADNYGITPYPFYLGIVIALLGLLLTLFWVKDTIAHAQQELKTNNSILLKNVFFETTVKNKTLSSVTQAGLVNNLNDGMIWGLLPILLISIDFDLEKVAVIGSVYPAVWGIGQLFTGKLSDHVSKRSMLFGGMLLQGIAILIIPFTQHYQTLVLLSSILGIGTAMVYPTFLSTIAQATNPEQRAESIGTFRLWRDLGYAIGAVISGITADLFGIDKAIILIGLITVFSSLIIRFRMPKI
ncbi:MAG: MFS transporter [Bacteroidetes bacterium]|nr:MAG: MFS transporter [Bacteroidota bacterium]